MVAPTNVAFSSPCLIRPFELRRLANRPIQHGYFVAPLDVLGDLAGGSFRRLDCKSGRSTEYVLYSIVVESQ
jgi:hypothetical protein